MGAERFSGRPEVRVEGDTVDVTWPTVTAVDRRTRHVSALVLAGIGGAFALIAWLSEDRRGWGVVLIIAGLMAFLVGQPFVARRRPNRLSAADGQLQFLPPEPFFARDEVQLPLRGLGDVRVEQRSRPAVVTRGRGGPAWWSAVPSYDVVVTESGGAERLIARGFLEERHAAELGDVVRRLVPAAGDPLR